VPDTHRMAIALGQNFGLDSHRTWAWCPR
jgi:hypothetical protein